MGLALDIFPLATLVASFTSFVLVAFGQRLLAPTVSQRFVFPAAMSLGYLAGYAALPTSRAALAQLAANLSLEGFSLVRMASMLAPQRPWHWLPYLGLVAVGAAIVPNGERGAPRWPWLAIVSTTALAGFLITPTWPVLGAPWPISIGVAIGYLLLIAMPIELLPSRLVGQPLVGVWALSAAITALAIGVEVSMQLAQLAAIA